MTVADESVARPTPMREFGRFEPVDAVVAPRAYVLSAEDGALVSKVATLLELHGVRAQRTTEPAAMTVEAIVAAHVDRSARAFQGHQEMHLVDVQRTTSTITFPAGSLLVRMDQPLARLAFHLLEPTSDDGLVAWNVLDEWLADGKTVPVYRVLPDVRHKPAPNTQP